MTPNDRDMLKVKDTNMHATYPPGRKFSFVLFALPWAILDEIEIFEAPFGYNVKIKLLTNSKFQNSEKDILWGPPRFCTL